jgi:hypothetical protein
MRGKVGRVGVALLLAMGLFASLRARDGEALAAAHRRPLVGEWFAPIAAPPTMDVTGIADSSTVSGTVRITVTITGGAATEVDVLVDGAPVASATAPPYRLTWDTTGASAGPHTVIVQAKDANGETTQARYAVDVNQAVPAPAAPSAAATVAPTNPTPAPTAVPTAVPSPTPVGRGLPGSSLALVGAGILLVGACVAGGWYAFGRVRRAAPVPPVLPVLTPNADRTEIVDVPEPMPPRPPPPTFAPPKPIPPVPPAPDVHTTAPVEATLVRAQPRPDPNATVVPAGALAEAPRPPKGRLRLIQGGPGEFEVTGPEIILGRDPKNSVVIKDALASRKHARIFVQNGVYWIEDLKSLNHTYVNGKEVTQPLKLDSDDQIRIGEVILAYSAEPEA